MDKKQSLIILDENYQQRSKSSSIYSINKQEADSKFIS